MGLEKAIRSGKERRRPWYDSRCVDGTCRNHGSCPWCRSNWTRQARGVEDEAGAEVAERPAQRVR